MNCDKRSDLFDARARQQRERSYADYPPDPEWFGPETSNSLRKCCNRSRFCSSEFFFFGNAHQVFDEMSEMKIDSLERVLKPGYVCALCVSHIYMFIFKISLNEHNDIKVTMINPILLKCCKPFRNCVFISTKETSAFNSLRPFQSFMHLSF